MISIFQRHPLTRFAILMVSATMWSIKALSILSEITDETAAARMCVETIPLALAASPIQKYCDSKSSAPTGSASQQLYQLQLRRALDYISTNIADDVALADLAQIAGLSPFHFTRKFSQVTGVSPHRHISRVPLANAMAEIAAGRLLLARSLSTRASPRRRVLREHFIARSAWRQQNIDVFAANAVTCCNSPTAQ